MICIHTVIGEGLVRERLFSELKVDGYFMEYDSDRAGGFEPLRFIPNNRMVVLGLITSKTPELENKDDIRYQSDLGGGATLDCLVYPLSFVFSILGYDYYDFESVAFHEFGLFYLCARISLFFSEDSSLLSVLVPQYQRHLSEL